MHPLRAIAFAATATTRANRATRANWGDGLDECVRVVVLKCWAWGRFACRGWWLHTRCQVRDVPRRIQHKVRAFPPLQHDPNHKHNAVKLFVDFGFEAGFARGAFGVLGRKTHLKSGWWAPF